MAEPNLSVIVPAYNEASRLQRTLGSIRTFLRKRGASFEILVVDDGSSDETAQVAERFSREQADPGELRLLRHFPNRGKGYSVRRGMLEAVGELGLLTDADLSTPITELSSLEQRLIDGGLDIAIGSRDLAESRVEIRQPWWRENLGRAFNRVVRGLTGLPYWDTQCGFKLFRLERCREVFQRQQIHGFVFDVEILFIARKWGLRVEEVPVIWRHAEGSKVSLAGHAASVIVDLLRVRLNNARSLYSRPSRDPRSVAAAGPAEKR